MLILFYLKISESTDAEMRDRYGIKRKKNLENGAVKPFRTVPTVGNPAAKAQRKSSRYCDMIRFATVLLSGALSPL